MENSNQDPISNENSKHPKPSDEVQLEIETVTPDTEKDVVPTENNKDNEKRQIESAGNESDAEQNPTKENANGNDEIAFEKEEEQKDKEHVAEQPKVDDTNNEAQPENGTSKEGDDERDQIETVSP